MRGVRSVTLGSSIEPTEDSSHPFSLWEATQKSLFHQPEPPREKGIQQSHSWATDDTQPEWDTDLHDCKLLRSQGQLLYRIANLSWLILGFLSEPIALWEASSDLLRLSLFLFVCLFVFSDFLWHSLIAIITSYYNYFSVYFPYWIVDKQQGLPWWLLQCRRWGFDPWFRKTPKEGYDYPLQYSCLVNPTGRGAWQAMVRGVTKSWTWLSN